MAGSAPGSQYAQAGVEGLYPGQTGSATATSGSKASAGGDSTQSGAATETGAPNAGQDSFYNMQGMFAGAGGYSNMQYVQAQYAQHVSQQAQQAASGNGL